MIRVDQTKLMTYGDRLGDGAVQLSFTFPVTASEEAKAAAKLYVQNLGLKNVQVAHMEPMGGQFTFFVVYANSTQTINLKTIRVPKIESEYMDYKTLTSFMEKNIKSELVILGACTGSDAHTVGIDAIFNMKGIYMDYGLERYPLFKAINLRSQIDNKDLVKKAEEMGADAILVSQIVTQRGVHEDNLKELKKAISESKKLKPHLITIVGGPKIDHALAKKLGFDAGFGPGTKPSQVASFIVDQYLKRRSHKKVEAIIPSRPEDKKYKARKRRARRK